MGLTLVQNYMIGIVLGMVVVLGGLYIMGSYVAVDQSLNSSVVGSLSGTLDKSREVTLQANKMTSSLQSISNKGSPLGWLDVLIGSAWNGLKTLGTGLDFMGVALVNVGVLFGVPPAITALVVLVAGIVIVFGIWMAVMRVFN